MDSDGFKMLPPSDDAEKIETPAPWRSFDFDAMATLATGDPDAFERARAAMLDEQIERMKSLRPERLRGLQFRIDMERRRRKPLANCAHFLTLMWECFYGLEAPLSSLSRRIKSSLRSADKRRAANDESFR